MGFLCNKQKSVSIPSGTGRAAVCRGTGQGDTGTRATAPARGQGSSRSDREALGARLPWETNSNITQQHGRGKEACFPPKKWRDS